MTDGAVPGVGDRAPSFTLRKTFEEKVSLDDLLEGGPLLLAFYVFDFGSV
jgi:peroxiredoxin